MSEIARRADGAEVKIGTCECMYYLRYEDRFKVVALPGNVDPAHDTGLFFRLPFPDEDDVAIGEYEPYNRSERLYQQREDHHGVKFCVDYTAPELAAEPGLIQVRHPCGLLCNLPCYHGERLPDNTEDLRFFWNGKSWFWELAHIKVTEAGILPVIHCRHCRKMWRLTWQEILPWMGDLRLRDRLAVYNGSFQHK